MFGFVQKMFFVAMIIFSFNVLNVNSLECVSMNNQECKTRTKIINTNNNEPVFYPFSIKKINAVEVVEISMIHMLNCVFLILLKT